MIGARRIALWAGAAALLAGPTVLAFARGGYFDAARLWAAIAAWVLVALVALAAPRPLPRTAPGIAALAGLAGLLGWTALSLGWAPLRAPATDDVQRLALYLGALAAATALLRGGAARAAVPVLAAGVVVVTLYGLSERLLPGLVDLTRSRAAMGRLDQPLTYWNAMGALAAMGFVLCARLAGEDRRPAAMRAIAAAASVPLGAGIALSFSRGAVAAAVLGLGVLAMLDARRSALRGAAIAVFAALAGGVAAAALPAVRTLEGSRETEGLVLLAALVALMLAAGVIARRGHEGTPAAAPPARVRRRVAVAVLLAGVALTAGTAAIEGRPESGTPAAGATVTRLSSTASNRYAYWDVALGAFADAPLRGHGSGSFTVVWLREREVDEVVRDAHSLELETAAELGLVGLALLAVLAGGVVAAGLAALRRERVNAVGPVAALAVWAAHSALDWDWEMPALTLVAVLLAGVLLASADEARAPAARVPATARAAVMLVALAFAGGLAVELRSANLVSAVKESAAAGGDVEQDLDGLADAERLTIDKTTPQLERAKLLLFARRDREAAALAERMVVREPENALAWGLVGLATKRIDPERSRDALRRQERLIGRP